jgi:DNA-binding ferritin-like protein
MKQFRDFISEARQMPEFEPIRPNISGVVIDGLNMVIRGQITHWNVKNYATHEALGDFYETLKEQLDHLVESCIAVGYDTNDLEQVNINVQGNDLQTFEIDLMQYRDSISETIAMMPTKFGSIEDILVSIQKTIDTMSYKLTLS